MSTNKPLIQEIQEEFKKAYQESIAREDAAFDRSLWTGFKVCLHQALTKDAWSPITVPTKVIARRLGLVNG
ncbi:MAG: hypothetical protein WCD70_10955 [Alphaproteobacteria bacterium]